MKKFKHTNVELEYAKMVTEKEKNNTNTYLLDRVSSLGSSSCQEKE